MIGLLQVGLKRPDGSMIYAPEYDSIEAAMDEMGVALLGSAYMLNKEQTRANDGIAMIDLEQAEAFRLLDDPSGEDIALPSGYFMEVPTP